MVKRRGHLNNIARIASAVNVMAFLCLYVLFALSSPFVSEMVERRLAGQTAEIAGYKLSGIECFFIYADDFHEDFPQKQKVKDLPFIPQHTEALETAGVIAATFVNTYCCVRREEGFFFPEKGRHKIINSSKNKFYCRI